MIRKAMFDRAGFRFCAFINEGEVKRIEGLYTCTFVRWCYSREMDRQ